MHRHLRHDSGDRAAWLYVEEITHPVASEYTAAI
jgi:hypothetical protein